MNIKKQLIASAIALSLSSGATYAGSFAESVVQVSNLKFSQGGTILTKTDFSLNNFTSSADSSALLNGISASASSPATARFDSDLYSNATSSAAAPTDNSFTINTGSPTANYAAGDQLESGSPVAGFYKSSVTGLVVPSTDPAAVLVSTGANLSNASYVSLSGAGNGSSSSNNGLESKFKFSGISGIIDLTFGITAYLETFLDPGDLAPSTASAALSVIFSLVEVGSFGGSELIQNNGTSTGGLTGLGSLFSKTGAANAPGAGFGGVFGLAPGVAFNDNFTLHTSFLDPTKTYQLSSRISTQADAAAIPEPSVIALLGLGLIGFGVTRKKTVR